MKVHFIHLCFYIFHHLKGKATCKPSLIAFPNDPGFIQQIKINIKHKHIETLHYSLSLQMVPGSLMLSIALQDS